MTILQIAREEAGLSGFELARRANVNKSLISQIEKGFRKPYPKFRARVSEALGLSEDVLFNSDGSCKTIAFEKLLEAANE